MWGSRSRMVRRPVTTVETFPAVLDRAIEMIAPDQFRLEQEDARRQGRYLGLGLATYVEGPASAPTRARTSASSPREGVRRHHRAYHAGAGPPDNIAQLVARELGIDPADVTVVTGDTTTFSWGAGTYASACGLRAMPWPRLRGRYAKRR